MHLKHSFSCLIGFFSIDATHTLDRLCRFVNDEKNGNAVMKLKVFNHFPRLCLFAAKDIEAGEEIRYDYGNEDAPWRKVLFDFQCFVECIEIIICSTVLLWDKELHTPFLGQKFCKLMYQNFAQSRSRVGLQALSRFNGRQELGTDVYILFINCDYEIAQRYLHQSWAKWSLLFKSIFHMHSFLGTVSSNILWIPMYSVLIKKIGGCTKRIVL